MPQKNYRQDPDFREYVRWSALPKGQKQEEGFVLTKSAWAEKHGYDRTTLWRWEQADAFDEMMEEITETWIDESIPGVVATAKQVALEPRPAGHKDRKLLLELAGKAGHEVTVQHTGEIEHEHSIGNPRTMTEAELEEAMRDELRKKPRFADASDEELDQMIDAFTEASVGKSAEKDEIDLFPDPPDYFKEDETS